MQAKELKNGVHKHNLDCIKTIKEKYSEPLLKLRKDIIRNIRLNYLLLYHSMK